MASLKEILSWFEKNKYPTQEQFKESWTSFWHKSEKMPMEQVVGLQDELSDKVSRREFENIAIGMIYKPPVMIFEDLKVIYTDPKIGWAVKVLSEGYIYQFDGSVWNNTGLLVFPEDVITSQDVVNVLGRDENKVVSQSLLTSALSGFDFTYYKKRIYDSDLQAVHAVVPNFYISARIPTLLSVQRDFIELAAIKRERPIGRLNACYTNGIIHIIASDRDVDINGVSQISYYKYSVDSKKITKVDETNFSGLYESWSIIEFKGSIYFTVSCGGNFTLENSYIDLYKITELGFSSIGLIAQSSDIWGRSVELEGVKHYSLPPNGYIRSSLSVCEGELYCTFIGSTNHSLSKYLVFTKQTRDLKTWNSKYILSNARANNCKLIHYNSDVIYVCKAYSDNTFNFDKADIVFCLNGSFNKGYFSLLPLIKEDGETFNEDFNLVDIDDDIIISITYKIKGASVSGVKIFRMSKRDIYGRLKGGYSNDKGCYSPIVKEMNIGDSFILDKAQNTTIPLITFPYTNSVKREYLNLGLSEIVRVVFNGSQLGWSAIRLNPPKDRVDSIVYQHNAQFNPFFSSNFRIPCISDSPDGNILYATSDIRYLSGNDVDIIEVGFCRSMDNGYTWQDYSKIFSRDDNANILNRVHDCSLCVDKNIDSPNYGRIWAFAKMIDTNLPEHEWEDAGFMSFLCCYSDDEGLTWSVQKPLTGLFPEDAFHISTGVAPGITLDNGTLIQPIYFTRKENGLKVQRASFIYSTDGQKWTAGDITNGYGGENTIVQLPNGGLLMNARDAFSSDWSTRRIYTLDGIGKGWVSRPEYETLRTVNCQESLVCNRGIYLYSQPTGYIDGSGRNLLTIFKSKDLINWEKFTQVTNAPSRGYSTLIFRDNKLGILYEGEYPYDIVYTNYDYLIPFLYM